ncbi:Ldh family oxidoreductase [Streptomyces sp. NPDC056716]|uniref:Ldh family oxidoreductase n=1 Tax=unclassified Streptomyces TaxID=2593676 RepID=UPI0036768569
MPETSTTSPAAGPEQQQALAPADHGDAPARVRAPLASVLDLMARACRAASVPAAAVQDVAAHFLEGELRGKPSHGVAKFCFESRLFSLRQGPPRIVRQHGVLAVVDARREIGPLSAAYAVDVALERARQQGAGVIGVINSQRYGILAPFSERIAEAGCIGIVANTSRAEAVAPGGRTPVLGVNPLAFAVPTGGEPLSVDMSTTLAPMGTLWEARRSGSPLPPDCFVDGHGGFTQDADAAAAAVVFGGHRGFAVSLLVQILTGALFQFPMGAEVDSTWRTGYTFLAFDPSMGGLAPGGEESTARLVRELRAAAARDGGAWRLPGESGRERARRARATGVINLDAAVHSRLAARANGDFATD